MIDPFINRKYLILGFILISTFVLLTKLFFIQVVNKSYRVSADNNVLRYVTQYPARGLIYDRYGKLIVYNQAAYDLMIIPNQTKKIDTSEFCGILGISQEYLRNQLKSAIRYSKHAPSIFLKQISDETFARFQEKMFNYPGFYVQPRTLRAYAKPVGSHVWGYVSEVDENIIRKDPYYKAGDYIGKIGIEEKYEKALRGTRGVKIFLVDVYSRLKGSYANGKLDTLAIQGSNITTSIDLDLQEYGEYLMNNKRGSIVAIEPETGEILALVSTPTFDPSLLVGRNRSENYAKLSADTSNEPLYNRALMASYPPGSTFKPIIGLIGLQEGVITPETLYECHMGYLNIGCHSHPSPLNLVGAIENSCNSYFLQTYRRILENHKYQSIQESYNKWKSYLDQFGFGKTLGTDLINELSGFVPEKVFFDNKYKNYKWKALTILSMGIGQGELGATPLQIANMTAVIANRGYFYTPHLVKSIANNNLINGKFTTKHTVKIDSAHFEKLILGMENVVTNGTGKIASIKDIVVCGKTGTAQNPHGNDNSVFIAFAPKNSPRIAIVVYVENAGFGATYAAPIASLMIEKYIKGEISNKDLEKRNINSNFMINNHN